MLELLTLQAGASIATNLVLKKPHGGLRASFTLYRVAGADVFCVLSHPGASSWQWPRVASDPWNFFGGAHCRNREFRSMSDWRRLVQNVSRWKYLLCC
jgi:hypothetical protein